MDLRIGIGLRPSNDAAVTKSDWPGKCIASSDAFDQEESPSVIRLASGGAALL